MKLLDIFKRKASIKPQPEAARADGTDEEYQLPILSRGDFSFTAELRRRQENEMLKKRYGVVTEKNGEFI